MSRRNKNPRSVSSSDDLWDIIKFYSDLENTEDKDGGDTDPPIPTVPPEQENPVKKQKTIKFTEKIQTLEKLIELGESYDEEFEYECHLDLSKLNKIVPELKDLNNLIGLKDLKRDIVKQIVFLLLGIQTKEESDMRHVVFYGPPGVGKTLVAQIIGKIYAKMGLLSKGTFTVGKRTDFVAQWLGQTEHRTKAFLDSCKGGVLLIDEVYSLVPARSDQDQYAKVVIDTLNQFLSENSSDFVCVIAGYKEDITSYFFGMNKGLDRRFPFRYTIEGYSPEELLQIYRKFAREAGWVVLEDALDVSIFIDKEKFKFFGGDVRTFFEKCKEVHAERAVMLEKDQWRALSRVDVTEGYQAFLKTSTDRKGKSEPPPHMYA